MTKKYVLDTSALIYDPSCYKQFEPNSEIILPIAVIDELDKLKKLFNDAGKNARVAIKLLDEISNQGDISVGVLTDNNILIKIDTTNYDNNFGDSLYGDTRIVACAYNINKQFSEDEVVLVSRDFNLRLRSRALGVQAESYEKNRINFDEVYSGIQTIEHPEAAEDLLNHGFIDPRAFGFNLYPHECVIFVDQDGNELANARKVNFDKLKIVKPIYPWGISSRNKEQNFAINLIMDAGIPLVTLTGGAGCGKTIVALASALELVLHKKAYDKFIIYRPIQSVGNDMGYLPGTLEEKLTPWFQAIMDNFEILFATSGGDKWKTNFEAVRKKDRIQMEALTYIRGRSIPNAIMLIDECQNISKEEIKTILTRAGENTKIILTGDISQIDNKDLDAMNNGLTYAIEKFKTSSLAGHITFTKGERSKLATEAAEIL